MLLKVAFCPPPEARWRCSHQAVLMDVPTEISDRDRSISPSPVNPSLPGVPDTQDDQISLDQVKNFTGGEQTVRGGGGLGCY